MITKRENLKKKLKKYCVQAAAFLAIVEARANYLVMSTDAFAQAEGATNNLKTKLISLGGALFPLAIVIDCICMFFTRDQRAFNVEARILIGCCLAYALLVLVSKGAVVTTITNLFG